MEGSWAGKRKSVSPHAEVTVSRKELEEREPRRVRPGIDDDRVPAPDIGQVRREEQDAEELDPEPVRDDDLEQHAQRAVLDPSEFFLLRGGQAVEMRVATDDGVERDVRHGLDEAGPFVADSAAHALVPRMRRQHGRRPVDGQVALDRVPQEWDLLPRERRCRHQRIRETSEPAVHRLLVDSRRPRQRPVAHIAAVLLQVQVRGASLCPRVVGIVRRVGSMPPETDVLLGRVAELDRPTATKVEVAAGKSGRDGRVDRGRRFGNLTQVRVICGGVVSRSTHMSVP